MNIAYITSITIPSTYANRLQVLSMLKAFSEHNQPVTLLAKNVTLPDVWSGIVVQNVNQANGSVRNAISSARFLRRQTHDVWYCREPHLFLFLLLLTFFNPLASLPKKLVYEAHNTPSTLLEKCLFKLIKRIDRCKIITITHALKEDITEQYGIDQQKILVAFDGVDTSLFKDVIEQSAAREKLGLDLEKDIVLYTGNMFPWKGVYTLVAAAKELPAVDFVLVGGSEKPLANIKEYAVGQTNVHFVGHVPQSEVPVYTAAADLLVIPNSKSTVMSEKYTSPLKLFEYLLSGRPIVASDLPSIREVVDENSVYFFTPDNVASLVTQISVALHATPDDLRTKVSRAKVIAQQNTWHQRVERILAWL